MTEDLGLALQKAAIRVFEELTFLLPERDVGVFQRNAPLDLAASVAFRGPMCGKLVVAVYGGLTRVMAANMLGDTDSPNGCQQRDALKEVVNVICGNMLPHLMGVEAVYDIDAPVILEDQDRPVPTTAERSAQIQVGIGPGRAALQLIFHDCPDAEPQP